MVSFWCQLGLSMFLCCAQVGEQEASFDSSYLSQADNGISQCFWTLVILSPVLSGTYAWSFASCLSLQHPFSLKSSKGAPILPRPVFVFFVALFGFYVCYLSFNQITLENKREGNSGEEQRANICRKPHVPYEELRYTHFPKPRSYSR